MSGKSLSQITTALENDKNAIRQAILSGGGTCPVSHGFDSFASDIGTIAAGGSIWDSMRFVESTTSTPPQRPSIPRNERAIFDSLISTTTTSEVSHLYKIAHGYDDPQYLTVREYRNKTSKNALSITLCASFYNSCSYTSTLGTVTLYSFYYVPVYIPSYSTTSYSDCVDAGDKVSFFDDSQTTLTEWNSDKLTSSYILTNSSTSTYNDYIMGIYVYLKWKSSNKNNRIMLLHPYEIGRVI